MDQGQLDRHRAKIFADRPALTGCLQSAGLTVFDTDQRGFQFGEVAAHLNRRNLVVLHARSPEKATGGGGFNWLSPEEAQRFHGYKCQTAARQFLQARTLVRNTLSLYLGAAPHDIDLSCQDHMKPVAVCQTSSRSRPEFNVSHSGEWVTIALHPDLPVGIDIECTKALEIEELCNSSGLFTQNERDCLSLCPDSDQKAALFLQLWRCKEAIMKATGRGFALAPDSFDVLAPDGTPRTVIRAEGSVWRLRQFEVCSGPIFAVAVKHNHQPAEHHLDATIE